MAGLDRSSAEAGAVAAASAEAVAIPAEVGSADLAAAILVEAVLAGAGERQRHGPLEGGTKRPVGEIGTEVEQGAFVKRRPKEKGNL